MAIKNLKSIKTKDNTYIVADKVTFDADNNVLNFWKSLTAPETEDTLVYSADLSNLKTTKYDFNYDVETGLFTLLEDGEAKTEATILSGGGGSGGSTSVVKLTNQNGTSVFAVASGSKVELMFNFTSTEDDMPTGNGTCQIIVNSITKTTLNITQGLTTVDVSEYLSAGSNTVRVKVTDVYGNSKTLVYTISVIDLYLTSTFDATTPYSGEIIFKYIPYGAIEKTVHLLVDGKEVETLTTSVSGKQVTTTFSAMSHGVHTIEAYIDAEMDGLTLESEHLIYEIICITDDETTPMIASVYNVESVQQGTQVSIPYIVYDPTKLACDITLTVISNETVISTTELTVDRSQQLWNTRKYPVGVVTFKISYGDIYKSHTITVTESDIDVEAVTNDLELYLTSAGRSNGEANPASWEYGDISTSFENFNWSSVGWINDENGDTCLRLNGDAKAEIQFQPFSKDLRTYGKTIELEFAIRDVNNREAVAISCMSGDIGFEVKADTAYIKSEQSKVFCNYKEEKRVRLSFVIESRSEYRLLSIYLNGILSDTIQYPSTDNFTQSSPVNISIGSPYCGIDLYTIRSYTTALTSPSIVTNYIADMTDIVRKTEAYEQNDIYDDYGNISFEKTKDKNSIMIIIGELPQSKGDKKTVTIVYYDVENSTLDFEEAEVTIDVQGTSSQFFIRKNWKLKFPNKHYIDLDQLPAKVICIKVDYAEATGTHNTQNANFIETLYDEQIPPQADEPNVRTTIYGKPILLFHQENENATPTFYGKANFNTDKGAEDTFGFTKDYDVESWEFLNNTSDACNFLGEIPENWSDDFEARYPDGCTDISNFKKIHDWVVSTKDDVDKFRDEFEKYFNLHYALIYYVYTFFALMVDQRAKNMFITIWNGIGYVYFYDNDTCFGINNEGQLVFDYYHEDIDQLDGANVYNGQNSVLWCNFREAFADEIKVTYQTLRSSKKITYEKLIERFITNGSNKWSESIYNEDGEFKYISMLKSDDDASNLGQVRGSGEEHFAYFIENRINYCDSKWYASDYADDYVSLRIYTPSEWAGIEPNADITVTPYSNMYPGARYKANGTLYQERAWHNVPVTFKAPNETFNDTETGIYGASQLSSLGDLAPLYCGSINVSKANKIVILKVGDGTEGYVNTNLKELSVGTNRLLKIIDVQNCPNLATALGLANCPNIEEIYAKGSGITGVELPESGFLKIIELPATIANLTLKNQLYIETLTLEGYDSLKTLWIENCPTIDSLGILDKGTNIERARLTNVNWSYDDASFLCELINRNIAGIDENGANIDTMWIDGTCHIKSLTGAEFAEIKALYPYLTITYDHLESQLIYMSEDGTTELYRETIINVGNGTDPVANGTLGTPTKESTAQYHFTYSGWSLTSGGDTDANALMNVEGDRYVYVAFSKELRNYTVKFYNGTTLLKSVITPYGSDATYVGETPVKEGYTTDEFEFIGWSPEPTNIQGNTNCYAQYYDLREITDSWATIAENCLNGTGTDLYPIGSFKPVEITYEDGTVDTIDMEVVAHNHDELADDTNASWVEVITTIPNQTNGYGQILVYNDEIHNLCGSKHGIFDGSNTSGSTLPFSTPSWASRYNNFATVYDDEIHFIGDGTKHYKYDGTEWTEASILPVSYDKNNTVIVAFNSKLRLIQGSTHYSWDGTEWITDVSLPFSINQASPVVYNDELHVISVTSHYKFDGSTWSSVSTLPVSAYNCGITVYNDEIYILNSMAYSWNGSEWVERTHYNNCNTVVTYRGHLYTRYGTILLRFENPRATLTFIARNLLSKTHAMNLTTKTYNGHTSWNAGGWSLSDMRTYCNETLFSALPEELQNAIVEVKKLSDGGYYDQTILSTIDKLWILSYDEIGFAESVNSLKGQGTQYPVFTDANSRKKSKVGEDAYQIHYLRSSCLAGNNLFWHVNSNGVGGNTGAYSSRYVLLGFCIR